MDYEKAYKEALERAKAIRFGDPNSATANVVCEEIFPELAESEDEKIRQEILEYIDKATGCKEWVAWLEKQGEKQDYNPYKVTVESISTMVEKYANGDLKDFYDNIKVKCKDAMEYDKTWNEKQDEKKPTDSYCREHCKGFQETGKCYADGECKAKRETEQNPAWSEEDEEMFEYTISLLNYNLGCRKWLKSLKNRVQPHPKQEWSDEDEKIIDDLTQTISQYTVFAHREPKEIIQWLKSIKPQPHWKPTEEQMQSLYFAIITYSKKDDCKLTYDSLNSLYNDLKNFEI